MGDEITCNVGVSVGKLDRIACAGVVCRPSLITVAFPADPTSNDVAFIRVQIMVEAVPIVKVAVRAGGWIGMHLGSVGVYRLEAQVELRQFREVVSGKFPERKPLDDRSAKAVTLSVVRESA